MSAFRSSGPRFWLGVLSVTALLAGAAAVAQAGGGAGPADPAESEPATSTEPPAKKQAVHCIWTNKGVTGFCAVGAEAKLGAACTCTTIIEHKTRKFQGKVVAVR